MAEREVNKYLTLESISCLCEVLCIPSLHTRDSIHEYINLTAFSVLLTAVVLCVSAGSKVGFVKGLVAGGQDR